MQQKNWKIISKALNSLLPRWIFFLSWRQYLQRKHWRSQNIGDLHGFDKYAKDRPQVPYLVKEIQERVNKDNSIFDLGCNCGFYLKKLRDIGYSNLSGVDISNAAVEYGRAEFNLQKVDLHVGAFEDVLPKLIENGVKFDLIYSMGATVELVHPSFDVIRKMCQLSSKYIVLFIQEWGHTTPRMYEYEFQKQGFMLVKCVRPYDGSSVSGVNIESVASLLVFQKL